jgi:hypothetical protein
MIQYPDIPGITVYPVGIEDVGRLRFEMAPSPVLPREAEAIIERVWEQMRREQPRLYDGPVLLTDPLDAHGGRIVVKRGTYKWLATANASSVAFRALGVQGVVVARDREGREHVLLGRRGSEVRMYPGLWENAPSGTVSGPEPGEEIIGWPSVIRTLRAEGMEELGIDLHQASVQWIALLEDAEACSVDVVLRLTLMQNVEELRLPCAIYEGGRWEYVDAAWVWMSELGEWVEKQGHAVSAPTRGLVRWMMSQ